MAVYTFYLFGAQHRRYLQPNKSKHAYKRKEEHFHEYIHILNIGITQSIKTQTTIFNTFNI